MTPPSPALRARIEHTIRFLAIDAVERAKSGHPGAPMGLAAAAFELWDQHLRFDPGDPAWALRDRFVLSNGHASMLLYSLLHLFGFGLTLDDLRGFRQLGSRTPGHPEHGHTPGVETTTGPLGQGFATGVGMAIAARMTRARFGPDGPGNHFVYGIVSDGDLMEGISAEAGSLAGHLGLGNLVYLYDDNHITIDGPTTIAFSEDVAMRFTAQRWHVQSIADGNDAAALRRALEAARAETARPSLILLRTTIGYGSPHLAGQSKTHGAPLGPDETRATKEAAGWPLEPTFLVPEDVRAYLDARIAAKRAERAEADAGLARWRAADPERAARWDALRAKHVPEGFAAGVAAALEGKKASTRKHSGAVIQHAAQALPWLVGGSADLAESNVTRIQDGGDVGPAAGGGTDPFAGRNLHYGIREHAMAAASNGISLDGTFVPYAGTFLVFSDYLRPALRLACLMGVRVVYVFTHDSIFLGEDGPTHQPIEHLDALRVIPGLTLFRPADGVETAMAWAWALERARGPVALALTRQDLPPLVRPKGFVPADVWRGGYGVVEPGAKPDVVLLATGSEVSLSVEAAAKLAADGIAARVVSAPCLELFAAQPEDWRRTLLAGGATPVVAVEAARGESFRRFVGPKGLVVGIDRFGASAPIGPLAETFGLTPDQLAERVRQHLRG
ncbi:MAG: transketolase [Deltaproteobacteria bacterium]|nr:transketolase [Deltaproteobacteria bacterium]